MPLSAKPLEKLYYSIGEVAEMLNVNSSLIRYWEKEFKAIHPRKNRKGDRLFTQEDIETVKKIYQLVKEDGMTLEGAKKMLKTKSTQVPIVDKLEKIKLFLQELHNSL